MGAKTDTGYDVEFHFSGNANTVKNEFGSLDYRHGKGTYTGDGIEHAYDKVIKNRARNGVKVKMVVITDGKSSSSSKPGGPASDMRNRGIEMIAMGWGDYEMDDLRDIASNNNDILTASSSGDLKNKITDLIEVVCD